jgi:hypothetical protein
MHRVPRSQFACRVVWLVSYEFYEELNTNPISVVSSLGAFHLLLLRGSPYNDKTQELSCKSAIRQQKPASFRLLDTLRLSQMRRRACEGEAGSAASSEETKEASSIRFLLELTISFSWPEDVYWPWAWAWETRLQALSCCLQLAEEHARISIKKYC